MKILSIFSHFKLLGTLYRSSVDGVGLHFLTVWRCCGVGNSDVIMQMSLSSIFVVKSERDLHFDPDRHSIAGLLEPLDDLRF